MNSYRIFVDGKGYAGESEATEDAQPGPHNGWTHDRARKVSAIQFGEPIEIVGVRNLTSHLDRIMRRIGDTRAILIQRVDRESDGSEGVCLGCGRALQIVRPGKSQCSMCG